MNTIVDKCIINVQIKISNIASECKCFLSFVVWALCQDLGITNFISNEKLE